MPERDSYQDDGEKEDGQGMTGNAKIALGTIARSFHWILGLAIIGMITYGR